MRKRDSDYEEESIDACQCENLYFPFAHSLIFGT